MKPIIIYVKNLASGGAEKQAVLLAKTLADHYDVHIVMMGGNVIDKRFRDTLQGSDITVHAINAGRFASLRATVALFKKLQPAVVFSYLTAANFMAAIAGRMTGTKVVTGLRSVTLPRHKRIADRFVTNRLAAATICNAYAVRDAFADRGFNPGQMKVITNCFESILPERIKPARDVTNIISIGRFVTEKDYEIAIASVAEARKATPDLQYTIVGYGALEDRVRSWVRQYGIDDITNILINPPGIPSLLDEADIYLSTSRFEGTSNAILEAMNADLPVVATDTGDNSRMIVDGVNGYIHPVGDVKALAASLSALAADASKRRGMGRESKKRLAAEHSTERFVNDYRRLIEDLS